MEWLVYLSGEIHTEWRHEVQQGAMAAELPLEFLYPQLDHNRSDNCGEEVLGPEEKPFWKDHKAAKLNTIRNRTLIERSDIVVVRFGEKYRQWNAAFDAGVAVTLGKPLIVFHDASLTHALKEIDAVALAVVQSVEQLVNVLQYVTGD